MHLVADVGNTETVLGMFEAGSTELVHHWRFSTTVPRTADEFGLLIQGLVAGAGHDPSAIQRGVLGSVVPSATGPLLRAMAALSGDNVYQVDGGSDLPIELDVDEPLTVGADRIANTLAASRLYGRDTIAVDLGTATTFDCITKSGVFLGGVIAPGILVGLDWLSRRTAKLPRVELRPPVTVIGRRTESCIRSGVFYMAVDGADGVVDRIKGEWSPDALVVATGGYATVVGPHSRTITEVEPFLTLIGLEMAGDCLEGSGEHPDEGKP